MSALSPFRRTCRSSLPGWLTWPVFGRVAALLAICLGYGPTMAEPAPEPALTVRQIAAAAPIGATSRPTRRRPRVGLVLSGGGARGMAHVGVLKVLERARVPVDLIAGTSMGAIIGGLYASGMSADALEQVLLGLDWDSLFANRVPREALSLRRKEEDFEISPALEMGLHPVTGMPMLPLGSVSSRGLEWLLRRYTLPVRQLRNFDVLPIPFRAVATDMENGQAVIFREGDLATILRASMSVPGVFPPTEVNGRILGDGGLVNNLPVDVVREMGADLLIVVNIGTPLSRREALGTAFGMTAQMINILTEQNVQNSIRQLGQGGPSAAPRTLLIEPDLGTISAGDFSSTRPLIALAEQYTETLRPKLEALALPLNEWHTRQKALQTPAPQPRPIVQIRFADAQITHPERYRSLLESQIGQPFDLQRAERDSQRLAATDDYLHADYQLDDMPEGSGLVFSLEEKPWGPNYFRLGLGLNSDFAGQGDFNLKLSHNRHWLNRFGAEWRNRLQIGSVPRWFTELYQPIDEPGPNGSAWFVAAYGAGERRHMSVYPVLDPQASARSVPLLWHDTRNQVGAGLDLGQTWGTYGELRFGLLRQAQQIAPESYAQINTATNLRLTTDERALRLGIQIDRLDHGSFPTRGYRTRLTALSGTRSVTAGLQPQIEERFRRFETDWLTVHSEGRQTFEASLLTQVAHQQLISGIGQYTLGGFQHLSGYQPGQLSGNQVVLTRLGWYTRLSQQPVLTRGFFSGVSLEAGNAWAGPATVRLDQLRLGSSLFLGADTGVGPLYFGLNWAPLAGSGLFLQLGRL
jgi:NTE family protein